MQENSQDVLTVGVFNKLLVEALAQFRIDFGNEIKTYVDEKIDTLDQKMMSGFEAVFNRFEKLENKIDNLIITKADREDILLLNKRIAKLEEKIA